ncbi:MAG: RNA 3'-terminal phosphate cyclase [Candidatus Promineifilaceae bacterium]|nr:RNA 3'-terminal phosphate cyclase [Candidatus Promineifilaceae bacterium]
MLVIDGSQGEGGGQVLRTSLSLSALTGRPFKLTRIRAGRSRPGLRPQHLTAVRAAAALCAAETEGAELNSTELTFRPTERPQGGAHSFDVTTASASGRSAGSVTLIAEALLWPLLFAVAPATVTLRGGTFVPFSPPYHYLAEVAAPAFGRLGAQCELELLQWGFMQAGQGEMRLRVTPVSGLQAANFRSLVAETIHGVAGVTNLPSHIPHRMARRAYNLLEEAGLNPDIEPRRETGAGPGAGIVLWRPQAGFSSLGRKGLPAEKVAEAAVAELLAFEDNEAAVDPHLADQLLLPLALAGGRSHFTTNRLTGHTLTNAALLRHWLDVAIMIEGEVDQPASVTVDGVGFSLS